MTIKTKLIGSLLIAVLLPMFIVALLSINRATDSLQESSFNQLSAIKHIKLSQIDSYFKERMGDVEVYATNSAVQMASQRFERAFKNGGLNGEEYKKWEKAHGEKLEFYVEKYGYYDLFFISPDGNVVYTAAKESDLGQNLKTGNLAGSPLAEAFNKGIHGTAFVDYRYYEVSKEPASFVSTPMKDADDNLLGVLVYQISLASINDIMQEREGMGETGETYLVGSDKKMRSDSYLDPDGHSVEASFAGTIEKNGVNTKATREALAGKTGTEIITDYNGNLVLSSYSPLQVGETTWALISEIDLAEVNQPINNLRNAIIILAIIIGTVFALLALMLANNIQKGIKHVIDQIRSLVEKTINGNLKSRADANAVMIDFKGVVANLNELIDAFVKPINVTSDYIDKIAEGDIPEKITDEYRGDFNKIKKNLNSLIDAMNLITDNAKAIAIGDLSVSVEKRSQNDKLMEALGEMIESLVEISNKLTSISEGNLTIDVKRRSDKDVVFIAMEEMIAKLRSVVGTVISGSENIASASQEMSSNAQQVSQGASEQASSAEEVSSSMEEMSSNIEQNTENAQQTEKISAKAAEDITSGSENVDQTVSAMKQIAEKVSIIGDIAFQTNILALNAAVEAARAGEHGKGFAVVAAEVRKLAEKSQVAAGEIDELTTSSVQIAEKSGELLKKIVPDIQKTSRLVQEITAASTEQNSGAGQINTAINQLNEITQQNAAASEEMATASEELSGQADALQEMVSFFKVDIQTKNKKANVSKKIEVKHLESKESNDNKEKQVTENSEEKMSDESVKIDMSKENDEYDSF